MLVRLEITLEHQAACEFLALLENVKKLPLKQPEMLATLESVTDQMFDACYPGVLEHLAKQDAQQGGD